MDCSTCNLQQTLLASVLSNSTGDTEGSIHLRFKRSNTGRQVAPEPQLSTAARNVSRLFVILVLRRMKQTGVACMIWVSAVFM